MGPNAIHADAQVVQHSAVMVQPVSVIMNVKRIMRLPKHVSAKQMVRPAQLVCVKQVSAQMIRVRPEQLKHAQLIWSQPRHLKRRMGPNAIHADVQAVQR